MSVDPRLLLAFDREVVWAQSRGVLRRVVGPSLHVPEGETLAWFDPLDGEVGAACEVAAGRLSTFATAVQWPQGYPDGLSGAAVGVGEPAGVVAWDVDYSSNEFCTDRGMGCVVTLRYLPRVVEDFQDLSVVRTALSAVRASMVHPLRVNSEVVGIAFHCGMGASSNLVYVGRDASGQIVALLADLDLLTGAELA